MDKFRHCLKTVLVAQLLNHYTHSTNAHDEGPGRGLQPWPSCSLLVCIFLVFSQVVFFSIRCIGCCHSAGSWGIYLSKCDFVMFECKVLSIVFLTSGKVSLKEMRADGKGARRVVK